MPAITEAAATKAASIHAAMQSAVEAIRSNTDLSEEGRTRQMARVYTQARDAMQALRQEFETEREATAKKLNREIFGNTESADVMSVRDARDRARRLEDPAEAAQLLNWAEDDGDEVLARAIAEQAHRNSVGVLGGEWTPVLQSYLDERPEVASRLEQLEGTRAGSLSSGVANDPEAHFFLAAPREIDRIPSGVIDQYASEQEQKPAETQLDRNRAMTIPGSGGGNYDWLGQHQGLS